MTGPTIRATTGAIAGATTGVVVAERAGAVATVRINRPEAHNALNTAVLTGLRAAVRDAARDPAVRVVIITGAGDRAFSAGADLKEIHGMDADRALQVIRLGQRTLREIETAPVPVIAAVNGVALGGGFELALCATFPVLSATATLGLPESGLGLMPGYGGTQRLPRAIGAAAAAHLMLTGARLDADRAHTLGLTPVPPVPPGELLGAATEIATRIAAQGPYAVRSIRTALGAARDAPLDAGLALETGLAALAIGGAESGEGVAAFLERRPARFADPEAGA